MVDIASSSIFPSASQISASNRDGILPAAGQEGGRAQLVENFDTFLELLVAQIQNQDPTNPVETETFTQQLVQFSELEQSIQSNDNLETILGTIQSQNAAGIVSYIGSTVNAQGATTTLRNSEAVFNLQTSTLVPEAQITIRDNLGTVVFRATQTLQSGTNEFVFNGRGSNGRQFNDGSEFTITATGTDVNGNFANISSTINGVVDGVDFSSAIPNLLIGTTAVPISAVNSVSRTF